MRSRLTSLAPRALFELLFAAVTLYTARPAFASLHLPLQDLPQHMAAISVLRRYAIDPSLREYVELTLSRTQYLLVYALGVPLSVPFGVEYATRLLVALTVVSLPYALRFALRRTRGDERLAALAWPFAWNPQMMLGFLNFLLGIPVALVAIGLFARADVRAQRRRQIALAGLALAAFYAHLIPYGVLGLGVLLQLDARECHAALAKLHGEGRATIAQQFTAIRGALGMTARRIARELAFFAPSFAAVLVWVLRSPARDAQVRAGGVGREIVLTWPDRFALPAQFRETVLDTQGTADAMALLAWGLSLMVALAAARAQSTPPLDATSERTAASEPTRDDSAVRAPSVSDQLLAGARARVGYLAPACALLYVLAPESYGWIWPIHTRFAVASVLLLALAFPRLRSHAAAWAIVAACGYGAVGLSNELTSAFQQWDRAELGDLDEALSRARPGRRLVALVPAHGSRFVVGNVPLLHAAAYYQVRGGHVATFSFADFPQSPFRYREGPQRPARLPPRWEWQTNLSIADPSGDYYDYVLTRVGHPEERRLTEPSYTRIYEGSEWNLFERRR